LLLAIGTLRLPALAQGRLRTEAVPFPVLPTDKFFAALKRRSSTVFYVGCHGVCRASLGRTAGGGCPYMGSAREQVAGGEEALSEVAGDDFFFAADGGKVDAGIPAKEYIDVYRYTLELYRRQDSRIASASLRAGLVVAFLVTTRVRHGN
jgi:hypothetical protein